VLAMGLAAVAFLHFRESPPAPVAPVRFQIQPPNIPPVKVWPVLSPDGRKLAFSVGYRLWVHSLDSGESRGLSAEVKGVAFRSPDSRFIALSRGE